MSETSAKPDFRLDHTMIRVFDQEKTMDFYTRILGMKILRQNEYPDGRFTNTFVGYQGEDEGTTIEYAGCYVALPDPVSQFCNRNLSTRSTRGALKYSDKRWSHKTAARNLHTQKC